MRAEFQPYQALIQGGWGGRASAPSGFAIDRLIIYAVTLMYLDQKCHQILCE